MRQRRPGPVRYVVAHPGAELYGSDRVMLESVIGFVQCGADVVVALPESGPLVAHLEAAGARVEITPTLVLRKSLLRPRNWWRLVSSALRGCLVARRLIKKHAPDAVYVSTMTLPLWPFVASITRTPSLVHVHEAEQGASRLVKTGMYAPALLANDVVVNSEFSRGVLGAAFPRLAARAQVIYNGVAGPSLTTPARHELDRPVRLVYIGRLSPRKGPDLIVEAIATLPESMGVVEFDIVGDVFSGYEWFDEQLRARIDELGLHDQVRLLGFRSEVWDAVDACDIVVIPSRLDEPFGNTAVEGVLAGRPVLVSDTSGLREATAGVATVIHFAPDNVASLAHAITAAVERWNELEPQLAAEAEGAEQRFSIERYRREIAGRLAAVTRPS